MRDDLCLSDSQYSYITGIGFTFPYCLFLLVFGWAVDRFRHLVVEMLVAAQVGLAVCGAAFCAASTFSGLIAPRALEGLCLAAPFPCILAILAEIFPRDGRAQAAGVVAAGQYAGYAGAFAGLYLTGLIGWRATALLVAMLVMAVVFALGVTVRAPEMPHLGGLALSLSLAADERARRLVNLLLDPVFSSLLMAAVMREMGRSILMNCFSGYYQMKFNAVSSYGTSDYFTSFNAIATACASVISCYFGGRFGSLYGKKHPAALAIVPALGCFAALPLLIGAVYTTSIISMCMCIWFAYLFGECWKGCTYAVLQNHLPNDSLGIASAVFYLFITIFGEIAEVFVSSFNTFPTENKGYKSALLWTLGLTYIGAGSLYILLAKRIHMKTMLGGGQQQRGPFRAGGTAATEGDNEEPGETTKLLLGAGGVPATAPRPKKKKKKKSNSTAGVGAGGTLAWSRARS